MELPLFTRGFVAWDLTCPESHVPSADRHAESRAGRTFNRSEDVMIHDLLNAPLTTDQMQPNPNCGRGENQPRVNLFHSHVYHQIASIITKSLPCVACHPSAAIAASVLISSITITITYPTTYRRNGPTRLANQMCVHLTRASSEACETRSMIYTYGPARPRQEKVLHLPKLVQQ